MPSTNADNPDAFEAALDGFAVGSRPGRGRGSETLDSLAGEFAERTRTGQQPAIEEYARKYPHLAAEIRELFPTVAMLEQWKLDKESECLRRNVPNQFPLKRLGDCELIREIGRGGMGIVFEATDERSGRQVAVKVLPWRFGGSVPRWRERFLKEAETVTRLRHDNIVPIYRVGDQDDYIFYVMQLINGVSLDRVIQQLRGPGPQGSPGSHAHQSVGTSHPRSGDRGYAGGVDDRDFASPQSLPPLRKRDWPAFAAIISQAAAALCFAHVRGVLHNDVKPGNLLLDADRRVLVTDFGLARSVETKQDDDGEGLSGTLRYMAPERFTVPADERSDVYSLGATLYELATLRPAFTEPDRQRLVELLTNGEFIPPADVVPDIPPPLETMILKAMAADPKERYQSVAEFAADLMRFQNGRPIQAKRPGGLWRRWRKWIAGS